MKERPILFSSEMVRAIMEGRKTQTRRVVKPQPLTSDGMIARAIPEWYYPREFAKFCPYGQPGDRLWVRETWATEYSYNGTNPSSLSKGNQLWFKATKESWDETCISELYQRGNTRPSIFMPRWASRITLEIVSIRVERVQEITDDHAIQEGVDRTNSSIVGYPRTRFQKLWDSLNAKRGYSWESNPWVWVIEFKRVTDE